MIYAYLQTVVIVVALAVTMIALSKLSVKKDNNVYIIVALLLYAFVFGQRYLVGVDFFQYDYVYDELLSSGKSYFVSRWEPGFRYISVLLASLKVGPMLYFGVIAFLQLSIIIFAFRDKKEFIPFIFFTFIVGCSWLTFSNGLRHILAVAIWVLAIRYAVEGKLKNHYIAILIATLFHKSSLLLLVFYPLIRLKKTWFSNIRLQIMIYVLSIIIIQSGILSNILLMVDDVALLLGYDSYMDRAIEQSGRKVSLGLGFVIITLSNFIIILQSNKMKEYIANDYITKIYDFFFIGIVLRNIFMPSQVLSRVNYFFGNLSFIIGAITLYYLFSISRKSIDYKLLRSLYVLLFIATIYSAESNTALFVFRWQEDLYYVKDNILSNILQ